MKVTASQTRELKKVLKSIPDTVSQIDYRNLLILRKIKNS